MPTSKGRKNNNRTLFKKVKYKKKKAKEEMNLLLDGKGSTSFRLCFLTSTIFPVIHLIPFIWRPLTASPYLHRSTPQLRTCLPRPDTSTNQENSYHLHGGSKSTTVSPNTASKFKVRPNNIVTCV